LWLGWECLFSIRFEIQEEGYSRNWRKVTEIETNRNHISTKMGMVGAGTRGTTGKYLPQDQQRSAQIMNSPPIDAKKNLNSRIFRISGIHQSS
jgi:hypothetical protein